MNLGVELSKQIRNVDHFDYLEELAANLDMGASKVRTIVRSMNMHEVGEARQDFANCLALIQVYVEISKMKLSVMPDEWEDKYNNALPLVKLDSKEENIVPEILGLNDLI